MSVLVTEVSEYILSRPAGRGGSGGSEEPPLLGNLKVFGREVLLFCTCNLADSTILYQKTLISKPMVAYTFSF